MLSKSAYVYLVQVSQLYSPPVFSPFQGARVWIPHDQVVWIGGELTKDLKEDGVLEIELEDGNVSCCFMLMLFRKTHDLRAVLV